MLLIQPPIRDFYLTAKRTLPYGLACVAGAARRAGFDVAILDGLASAKSKTIPCPEELAYLAPFYGRPDRSPFGLFHHFRHFGYSFEHLARQTKASGAWLVGISSLFSAYEDTALATAAAVKKACPGVRIVLGGHHPTALPEALMAHPDVDFVLRGDGEAGLPALAQALRQGTPLAGVPGLVWRRSDGSLGIHPPARVDDLDRLPPPAFDLIDWHFYQRAGRGGVALAAGRGCPLRCTYCAVNAATFHGYRCRGVAHVMAELEAADRQAPLGFIDFEDEHLTADREWFLALMAAIRAHFKDRPPELRAMNGLLASSLDEEIIAVMRRSGFKTLNLALITTAADQLKRFGRPDLTAELDRVLELAARHDLSSVAYLIVAGPGQDPWDSLHDLLFLARRRVLAGVSVFYPAPGSADYGWCQRKGMLPDSVGLLRATALPLAHVTDRRQAVTLLRLGRILNFTKATLDQGLPLPEPAPAPACLDLSTDRADLGRILLAAFLYDGAVCGLDDEGRVYAHAVDLSLTRAFRDGLASGPVRGAIRQ
ncbi:MAG: B12-binding domain-containing radical SAM protein [Desulfatitalea sp.]|nr:B12-binding domain-containing radical SAM protein [Desulfatitalea sp.]